MTDDSEGTVARTTAIPREFSTARRNRTRNWTIIGTIIAMALTGPCALIMSTSAASSAEQAAAAAADQTIEPRYQAFAETVAARWAYDTAPSTDLPRSDLATATFGRPPLTDTEAELVDLTPSDLGPTGRGSVTILNIAWSDAQVVATTTGAYEIHTLLLLMPEGTVQMRLTIIDTPTGPLLAGDPIIEPYVIARPATDTDPEANTLTWPNTTDPQATPDNLAAAIRRWAQAYAADDRTALRDAVGDTGFDTDQIAQREYVGLGGFHLVNITPDQTAAIIDRPDLYATRARIDLINDAGILLSQNYDFLALNVNGNFFIRAWGPPGTAPLLAEFSNGHAPNSPTYTAFPTRTGGTTGDALARLRSILTTVADAQDNFFDTRFRYAQANELAVLEGFEGLTELRAEAFYSEQFLFADDQQRYCAQMSIRDLTVHVTDTTPPTEGPCPDGYTPPPAPPVEDPTP